MSSHKRVALSWSGGKDSLMALEALEAQGFEVATLLTTLNESRQRISMHGVRATLLRTQTRALGLALVEIGLPEACDNETYRARFAAALIPLTAQGITTIAFGDLFLADVRAFREEQMHAGGFEAQFPLWDEPTDVLARGFVESGHRAIIVCVDGERLDPAFLGRAYDARLLKDLPHETDPCGENGEFHSFVYAGPRFAEAVHFRRGRRVVRGDRFHFLDLLDGPQGSAAV
ncbi:MAG: ATP-binding protein [Gammaproteobacteria bacterium]